MKKKDDIIDRQLSHFFRVDKRLGMLVSKGLGSLLHDGNLNTIT